MQGFAGNHSSFIRRQFIMELEAIKKIIKEQIDIDVSAITEETTFEDLQIDSLDMVEIVMAIEDEFDVVIDGNNDIKCVGDLIKLCKK